MKLSISKLPIIYLFLCLLVIAQTGFASVQASPTSLTFNSQTVGTASAAQNVTFTNNGTASVTVLGVSITGQFTETDNCGNSLTAGQSCVAGVIFKPEAAGILNGTLTLSLDNGTSVAVPVTGTGASAAPTTSITALTQNNTSAADGFIGFSNGLPAVGNVSKINLHKLFQASTVTAVEVQPWFCGAPNISVTSTCQGHVEVGYNSNDATQVQKQLNDMASRGVDVVSVDWYGKPTRQNGNGATVSNSLSYADGVVNKFLAGTGPKVVNMYDFGALKAICQSAFAANGYSTQQACVIAIMTQDMQYLDVNEWNNSRYFKVGGKPVEMVFEYDQNFPSVTDWTAVWNAVAGASYVNGPPAFIFGDQNGFTHADTGGAYAWGPGKTGNVYLDSFYQVALQHPSLENWGGAWPGFNDTIASWSLNRVNPRNCGMTWINSAHAWADNGAYSTTRPLPFMQVATWNDYEEGSAIEMGIDNCILWSTPTVNGTTLAWNIGTQANSATIDHYEVYSSTNNGALMILLAGNIAPTTTSIDLSQYTLGSGTYKLYVYAVGKNSIKNSLSPSVSYTTGGTSGGGGGGSGVGGSGSGSQPQVALSLNPSSALPGAVVTASITASDTTSDISNVTIDWGDGTSTTVFGITNSGGGSGSGSGGGTGGGTGGGGTGSGTANLSVSVTGTGTVSTNTGAISCPTACTGSVPVGTSVTFAAHAATGGSFLGWGGACSGTAATCTVAANANVSVTASFAVLQGGILTASVPTGGGSIVSSPAGINCPGSCTAAFPPGTSVTITATPVSGWSFGSWTGSGTSSPTSYSTSFAATENPISEGHSWVNGGKCSDPALCKSFPFGYPGSHSVQTGGGKAYGTQTGSSGCSSGGLSVCDDSAAALNGTWSPDQTITATAAIASPNSATEIELHGRSNIPFGKAKLYEIDIRATNSSSSFINIVRWNGDGTWTPLCVNNGSTFGVSTGTVVQAVLSGQNPVNIKVYYGATLKVNCNDSSGARILSGNPGMGFYQNLGVPASSQPNFAWSSFSASSNGSVTSGCSGTSSPCVISSMPSTLTVQANFTQNVSSGPYSTTNEPAASFYPFTGSPLVFGSTLPSDKMQHLFVPSNYGISGYTGDQIAIAGWTNDGLIPINQQWSGGNIQMASPASDGTNGAEDQGDPVYYSKTTDPWYKLIGNTATLIIQAPNGASGTHASFPGRTADGHLAFWDQTHNLWSNIYYSSTNPVTLPPCSATTPQTACPVTSMIHIGGSQFGAFKDWDTTAYTTTVAGVTETLGGSGDNLGNFSPYSSKMGASTLWFNELMGGLIPHMLIGGGPCTNSQVHHIFPAGVGNDAWICNNTPGLPHGGNNMPPNGALFFLDYTDAQIASMNLHTCCLAQETVLYAMAHYGSFYSVTSNYLPVAMDLQNEDMESGLPYFKVTGHQHPFFNWLATQHTGSPSGGTATQRLTFGSTNNAPPTSQYRINISAGYGLPLLTCNPTGDPGCSTRRDSQGRSCSVSPGCDVTGHVHIADPCLLKRMYGVAGAC